MAKKVRYTNRFVQKKDGVIGPTAPRIITRQLKLPGDYTGVPQAYVDMAQVYASEENKGFGLTDELLELVQHMFTEEEATLCRHIKPGAPTAITDIARLEHRSVTEVEQVLEQVTAVKKIFLSMGEGADRIYILLSMLPGVFEVALVDTSMDKLSPWQVGFAQLFEKLYETGWSAAKRKTDAQSKVRYLAVGDTIESNKMALPFDKMDVIFEPFKTFAVSLCQCRMTEKMVNRGCDRPMENCVSMGLLAQKMIDSGRGRQIELGELLDINKEAEEAGLVNWTMNVDSTSPFASNTSCSCCGCCCHYMRNLTEFSMPATISPPHFLPVHYTNKCTTCGKCALACPMGAITVDVKNKTFMHSKTRCIGCGLCVVACNKDHALSMEAVPDYKIPEAFAWSP